MAKELQGMLVNMVNNQPLSVFLEFADLTKFKSAFETFGVDKYDHLADVQHDDLRNFGM